MRCISLLDKRFQQLSGAVVPGMCREQTEALRTTRRHTGIYAGVWRFATHSHNSRGAIHVRLVSDAVGDLAEAPYFDGMDKRWLVILHFEAHDGFPSAWHDFALVAAPGFPTVGERVLPQEHSPGEGVSHFVVVGVDIQRRRHQAYFEFESLRFDSESVESQEWVESDAIVLVTVVFDPDDPDESSAESDEDSHPYFDEFASHPSFGAVTWRVTEILRAQP